MHKLYDEKRNLWAQAEDLKNLCRDENREMNEDELTRWNKFLTDMDAVDKRIEMENRHAAAAAKMSNPVFDSKKEKVDEVGNLDKRWNDSFSKYMRLGINKLNDEERMLLNLTEGEFGVGVPIDPFGEIRKAKWNGMESRATNSVITNATYMAPTSIAENFAVTLKAIGNWMEACTMLNTPTGETLELPYYNDAGNDGVKEAEGTDAIASSTDLDSAKTTLNSYWMSSTGIKVGWSALRDTAYPVQEFVIDPLLKRLARVLSSYGTTGTGSTQPYGIAMAAVTGELASKATAPTQTDLNNLLRLVDYAYHTGPKSGWMFHSDTMFRMAATVKSTTYNQDPLWQPSFAAGIPATLLGYKYWINNSMNTVTTAPGNSVLFGDFSYFILRFAGPLIITRLEERYAELGQVGFLASQYFDSDIRMVGTTYAPIKKIKNIMT